MYEGRIPGSALGLSVPHIIRSTVPSRCRCSAATGADLGHAYVTYVTRHVADRPRDLLLRHRHVHVRELVLLVSVARPTRAFRGIAPAAIRCVHVLACRLVPVPYVSHPLPVSRTLS